MVKGLRHGCVCHCLVGAVIGNPPLITLVAAGQIMRPLYIGAEGSKKREREKMAERMGAIITQKRVSIATHC